MPESFDKNDIKFFNDKYRENDITNYINYYVENNVIYASLKSGVSLNKALTIDIALPNNYFNSNKEVYGTSSMILCITIIFLALLSLLFWFLLLLSLISFPLFFMLFWFLKLLFHIEGRF